MKKLCLRLAFGVTIAVGGCNSSQSPDSTTVAFEPSPNAEDALEVDPKTVSITDQQASDFAEQWLRAVVETDIATVQSLVDWSGILDRALDGFDVTSEMRKELENGTTSPGAILGLIGTISRNVAEGGSYRFVRSFQRGGETYITLRLLDAQGALNYHELRLKPKENAIIADGLLFASTGQSFSETLRTIAATVIGRQPSMIDRISGVGKQKLDDLQQLAAMSNAMREGEPKKALSVFAKMRSELRGERMPMLMRIMATDVEDIDEYLRAIDEFAARFPDETAVGLITLDAAIFREDHALLMNSYQQLQRFTGGDPLLTLMVGGVLANQGKPAEAKQMVDSIDPSTLGLATAHDFKLTVAMANDDHVATLNELMTLRDEYGYELSDLTELGGFERFVASPQHEQWKSSAKLPTGADAF